MKKILTLIFSAAVLLTGCGYDDSDLRDAIDDLDNRVKSLEEVVRQYNSDIKGLQTIVTSIQGNDLITGFTENTAKTGWVISFQSGETIEILNGTPGTDAPVVGVKEHTDGLYYWTLDGTFIEPMLPVTGATGESGSDGTTPEIGIDNDGYWTIDTGDGPKRIQSNGQDVLASDGSYRYLFTDVEDKGTYYAFHLADGSTIEVAKAITVSITIEADALEYFRYSERRTFTIVTDNATSVAGVTYPFGWTASANINTGVLTVRAGADEYDDVEGTVTVIVRAADGSTAEASFDVYCNSYQLRVLTFEDEDYKGTGGTNYWSGLIDNKQYGGPLLYGEGDDLYSYTDYSWTDEGNTLLTGGIVENWGTRVFWNGGDAISNYTSQPVSGAASMQQLGIPNTSGRRGSSNFAVHFGYNDGVYNNGPIPALWFSDNTARVIDHMYVTSTSWFLNSTTAGDGFASPMTADSYVDIEAIAYDSDGEPTGKTATFRIASGQDNCNGITDWTRWDLSTLGAAARVEFNVVGPQSDWGSYGFAYPAYFAYDDIAVRF